MCAVCHTAYIHKIQQNRKATRRSKIYTDSDLLDACTGRRATRRVSLAALCRAQKKGGFAELTHHRSNAVSLMDIIEFSHICFKNLKMLAAAAATHTFIPCCFSITIIEFGKFYKYNSPIYNAWCDFILASSSRQSRKGA